jgi:hypothetical protein
MSMLCAHTDSIELTELADAIAGCEDLLLRRAFNPAPPQPLWRAEESD